MKSKELTNRLLILMAMVCCCQQISAGVVVKTGKNKNSTNSNKDIQTATTKHPKLTYKAKTATTKKPEMEITTLLPLELDLDGRSAYINNEFVADPEEPVQDTSSPLYELLQQQMEKVMSNAAGKIEIYTDNSPQMKEAIDEDAGDKLKPPQKPLFSYDLGQFDDYDEEDTSEYAGLEGVGGGEYTPENCEDTQESLVDNDDATATKDHIAPLIHNNQQNLQNNGYGQSSSTLENSSQQQPIYSQLAQNKPYDSSNYGPQTQQVTSSIYNSTPNTSSYGSKKPQQNNNKNYNKPKPSGSKQPKPSNQQHSNQNSYGQVKPTEQQVSLNNYAQPKPSENYGQANNQNSFDKQPTNKQQSSNQKPQYASGNIQQVSFNNQKSTIKPVTQHSKPKPSYTSLNPKTQVSTSHYTSTVNTANYANTSTNPYFVTNPLTTSSTTGNPSLISNYAYGHNSNTETSSSPFSSTSSQKRHLTFRTVASSTQYVSSPLADLMFKFSIGMAKPANSNTNAVNNYGGNQAQIFNVFNDMEPKTDMK